MAIFEAYDPSRVASVAASLGEDVLSSGRALSEASATDLNIILVLCAVGFVGSLMTLHATYLLARSRARDGIVIAGSLGGAVLACCSLVTSSIAVPYANEASNRGYVITTRRIVLLDSGGRRTDVPASDILLLKRTGKGLVISRTNAPDVVIQASNPDLAQAEAFHRNMSLLPSALRR